MAWSRPVTPVPDELLSSYLIRSAWNHHADPYRFCVHTLGTAAIWNRDIDRTTNDGLLQQIAHMGDVSAEIVRGMTLRRIEELLTNSSSRRGAGPWINCLGIYHRIRRRHGLQVCVDCLRSCPAYLITWRLSFAAVCRQHGCWLLDACPHCDLPLMPHRQMIRRTACHACGTVLRSNVDAHADLEGMATTQHAFESALVTGVIGTGLGPLSINEVRHAVVLLRAWHLWSADVQPAVESQRVSARATFFMSLHRWLQDLPGSLKPIQAKVSPAVFQRSGAPTWLTPVRAGRVLRRHMPASVARDDLQRRFDAIRLQRGTNWRSRRASLLLNARAH